MERKEYFKRKRKYNVRIKRKEKRIKTNMGSVEKRIRKQKYIRKAKVNVIIDDERKTKERRRQK